MNVHHGDNHELVQLFDEVVFAQPWRSITLCYYLFQIGAPISIVKFARFQNQ
jgi:hypothetical protein